MLSIFLSEYLQILSRCILYAINMIYIYFIFHPSSSRTHMGAVTFIASAIEIINSRTKVGLNLSFAEAFALLIRRAIIVS